MSTIFIGDKLSGYDLFGVLCISIALTGYGIEISLVSKATIKGFYFAASAGGFIAAYSLLDVYGVRIAQNAVGFYSAVTIINGLIFCLFCLFLAKKRFQISYCRDKRLFGLVVQHHM